MKHTEIREHLRHLIQTSLPIGAAIPSERELCEQFRVSRMTVRQGIDALVAEGLLVRQQGRGTFVSQPKIDLQLRIASYSEEMRSRGMLPSTLVLETSRSASGQKISAALNLKVGAEIFTLKRLRLADGDPMCIETTWVSCELFEDFLTLQPPKSCYDYFSDKGQTPTWGEDTIEAINLSAEDASLLGVQENDAALQIYRCTYTDLQPVAYSVSLYRADRYSLWVPISGAGQKLTPPNSMVHGYNRDSFRSL